MHLGNFQIFGSEDQGHASLLYAVKMILFSLHHPQLQAQAEGPAEAEVEVGEGAQHIPKIVWLMPLQVSGL